MLIALTFAHFSSELLLKEQMIIPATKTFTDAGHIDAKLIDFSQICQKNPSEIGCFLLIVSWRSFPLKLPVKSADFSANFDFPPAKIARNRPIVPRILTFFPRKSREIGRFFREFAPENPAKFCFFFPRNIRSKCRNINDLFVVEVHLATRCYFQALLSNNSK